MSGHIRIPDAVADHFGDLEDLGAVLWLYRHADRQRYRAFDCADAWLMVHWRMSKRQVRRILAGLQRLGAVTEEHAGDRNNPRQIRVLRSSEVADHLADHCADHDSDHDDGGTSGVPDEDRTTARTTAWTTERTEEDRPFNQTSDLRPQDHAISSTGEPVDGLNQEQPCEPTSVEPTGTPGSSSDGSRPPRGPGRSQTSVPSTTTPTAPEPESPRATGAAKTSASSSGATPTHGGGDAGIAPKPEPTGKAKKEKAPPSKAYPLAVDAWDRAYRERFDSAYPWCFVGRDADGGRVKAWVAAARISEEDPAPGVERLALAIGRYLDAVQAGTAFPFGEPPTTKAFSRDWSKWAQASPKHNGHNGHGHGTARQTFVPGSPEEIEFILSLGRGSHGDPPQAH